MCVILLGEDVLEDSKMHYVYQFVKQLDDRKRK